MRLKGIVVALFVLTTLAVQGQAGPYSLITQVKIGGEGGWDYLSVDSAAHRLYVSHATKAVVVDTVKNTVIGEIVDTPGIHGAIAVPPDRIYTSNGRGNTASIVDAGTLKTIGQVATQGNPDYIMLEPTRKEVYTFNGSGASATVIDVATGKVTATIPLGGKPEAAQPDAAAGRVYVNIEDKNSIAVIDAASHTVVANWPIAPGEEATGLAIDTRNHRLFIGASNNLMLMMDSTNGKIVAQVRVGAGVDSTWFDPATGNAFSSAGEGFVTIAHEDSPNQLSVVQTLTTAVGARTMALDTATLRISLAAAQYGPPPAGGRGRGPLIPNSMTLLVYGPNGE